MCNSNIYLFLIFDSFCSSKSEKRPITSSSTSKSNSIDGSSKSVSKSSSHRPGQPGFSGSKLKISNRSKSEKFTAFHFGA